MAGNYAEIMAVPTLNPSDEPRLPRWVRDKAPATQAGCLAFMDGKKRTDNPYSLAAQMSRHRDWDEGWDSAAKWIPPATKRR
jgi:hypothetical protein